jgi:hypothetical protein
VTGRYRRVNVDDVEGAVVALKCLEDDLAMERRKDVSWIGEPKTGLHRESAAEARSAIENAIK